jgi:ATP-dependent DNA helicase RecG
VKLDAPIITVKGVGEAAAKGFAGLGIHKVRDLLDYLPFRYEDYSKVSLIRDLQPGVISIRAKLLQASGRYARRGLHITEAIFQDESGSIRATWFNQPYRAKALKQGEEYFVAGQYELSYRRLQIMNPSAELVKDFPLNTARIVPVYRQSKAVTTAQIRRAIGGCKDMIETLPEALPEWMRLQYALLPRHEAIMGMHYPESAEQLAAAKRRLGFEEVLELSLASLMNKKENAAEHALAIPFDEKVAKEFVGHLPFKLTDDQRKTVWQIYKDLEFNYPMNRLVEGDVGSGKTVIAAMAAVMAIQHTYQVALMAPTEILARQHYATLSKFFKESSPTVKVGLLVGGMKPLEKTKSQAAISAGETNLVVGTHALIQEKVDMKRLGLIVVDEQHRFGVEQRKELMRKAGHMPHVLSLTATPIPRSLALTLYGEMDVSILRDKPAGRLPIRTKLVGHGERDALYKGLVEGLAKGAQAYVVCPLVEESDVLEAKSAEKVFDELSKKYFKNSKVGLLHGRMKPQEKDQIMNAFAAHELDVLVTTTVIEVGVDVPNASIMVIESAERFGLAQLHQLRGRVGRGDMQSHCYLLLSPETEPTKRLRAVESSNDGFKLAEYDLELRGAGAIYGAAQHGALDLRVAKLTDTELIIQARKAAQEFLERNENLLQYKELEGRVRWLRAVTHLN